MNSNVHNQRLNYSLSYIPVTPASSYFILQSINSLQNPTTADFERLSEQYQQYFFLYNRTTKILSKISNLKLILQSLSIFTSSHITMWEQVTTVVLITTYTFCVLFLVCILLKKILTTIRDNV